MWKCWTDNLNKQKGLCPNIEKSSRNFVDSSGHTPQYVGCVIFLNCANCFVPGPPQPQHIWTPVCRVLGSRPAQPGPACSHPPPNVAKVESDQNVKMAKCVPPYTLHTVLHICRLQYNGHDMLCSGNTIIYSTIAASAADCS